jgi:hypothetical protein
VVVALSLPEELRTVRAVVSARIQIRISGNNAGPGFEGKLNALFASDGPVCRHHFLFCSSIRQ